MPRKSGPAGNSLRDVQRIEAGIVLAALAAWRLGGFCERSFSEAVDDSSDASFDKDDVEVDEEAEAFVSQFQMGQELLFVYWRDGLHGFEFHDDLVLHNQVCIEAGINTNGLIDHRNSLLAKDTQSSLFQFIRQSCLVNRFQQTWTQSGMHAKRCIDDVACDLVLIHGDSVYLSPRRQDRQGTQRKRWWYRAVMADGLSNLYQDLLNGSYDCVDRIIVNAYFQMGHGPAGFRVWWRALTGSDDTLDNAHLMRMAGRFSRRVRGYAKAHAIPVLDCAVGERKHDLAEEYRKKTSVTRGVFLILVGRARVPVWDVGRNHHLERKMSYVNHYYFHILDPDWGHLTIKMSGHPPFPAQVMLNGHEYVAGQASHAQIRFTKEQNCFTHISDPAGLAKIADTLSDESAIGRLRHVGERWIYSACLCFALDDEEILRSRFSYQFSSFQVEYSRNLIFEVGGQMEQVFQALVDRSRAPLNLQTIKTILGYKHRPKYRSRKGKSAEWEVTVETPTYDLTIFKLRCGYLTLKIYTKGERVLRIEVVAHHVRDLDCGSSLERFPRIIAELKSILERFSNALSCIDQCFIGDETLEQLPTPSQVGKATVGGVDFNKPRMRRVAEAVVSLSPSPGGFTVSALAHQVRVRSGQPEAEYGVRQAAYDLKKLRGKQIVSRVGKTRRYEAVPAGLKTVTALLVLRAKVTTPLLAATQQLQPSRGGQNPGTLDRHLEAVRVEVQGALRQLGIAA